MTEMHEINRVTELRALLKRWRGDGHTIALVPTMGNLHAGHLELVRQAKQRADRCVVSIFVNPMQFGAGEDFGSYPRTYESDRDGLQQLGTDLIFSPSVEEVYPLGEDDQTRVEVPGLSNMLCGASRPGHFVGVTTVVCKFFNMIQPDIAVFGEKDFQQLMVIRRMVLDLCMPVEVVGVPTVRESDGLAMSSRNAYLTSEERNVSVCLYETLCEIASAIHQGESDFTGLEIKASQRLEAAGFRPDYFAIRCAQDLSVPASSEPELVILAAAWLGKARLIDNLRLTRRSLD